MSHFFFFSWEPLWLVRVSVGGRRFECIILTLGKKTLIFNRYDVTVAAVFVIYRSAQFLLHCFETLFHFISHSYPADLAYMFLAAQSSEHSKTHSNYSTSVLAPPLPPKTLPSKPSDICQFVRKILSKCQVLDAPAFDVLG